MTESRCYKWYLNAKRIYKWIIVHGQKSLDTQKRQRQDQPGPLVHAVMVLVHDSNWFQHRGHLDGTPDQLQLDSLGIITGA